MAVLPPDQFDEAILDLVNQERTSRGLVALSLSSKLDVAADLQAKQLAEQDFFDHTNPITGSTIGSRARDAGYTIVESSWGVSENIAAGHLSAESVMSGWMNSEGHRQNILNPNYRHLGVGYYYLAEDTGNVNYNRYWSQVFGFGGDPGEYQAEEDTPEVPTTPDQPNLIEGTSAGDLLIGISTADTIKGFNGNDTLKGASGDDLLNGGWNDDQIIGGNGNDWLIGGQQSDVLNGGGGNDKLIGVNPGASANIIGKGEQDILIGHDGADTYVLGQNGKVFYDDHKSSSYGSQDYGMISGFDVAEGDRIQLEGSASDYVLGQNGRTLPSGTKIFLNNESGRNELIGIIHNVTITSLDNAAFQFV